MMHEGSAEKKPHIVRVRETFMKYVIIFADDESDSEIRAEELCNENAIDPSGDVKSKYERRCESVGIAEMEDLGRYEKFADCEEEM